MDQICDFGHGAELFQSNFEPSKTSEISTLKRLSQQIGSSKVNLRIAKLLLTALVTTADLDLTVILVLKSSFKNGRKMFSTDGLSATRCQQ